ncbi:MAG TPA: ParB N-terminal domain-containing protein [Polyangiaceae bacterium]|nr:ParB N-terminal domain-containing protein [Polyangiaceae bacterium]
MPENPAAEWVELESLKPWADNPRKNDKRAPHVADLIKRFGFSEPIIARLANREIIAGHTRQKACRLLRLQWPKLGPEARAQWHQSAIDIAISGLVPARFMDIDEDEAHLLALADNRSTENTPWDDELLRKVLPGFSLEDVTLAGWTAEQLGKMLEDKEATVQEIDTSALNDEFWLSVRGPVPLQPRVLEKLRAALEAEPGVEVTLGMTGVGK